MHNLGNNWNNYKEPNVWQSGAQGILLGVLGNITGGSGCCQIGNILCGGGYGGYGYGGYGYGGYGYGGYGYGGFGRIMTDGEFGAYAGLTVACLGMRAGATAIKNNKAKKAQIKKITDEITDLQDKIYNPQNYVESAKTALTNAQNAQITAKRNLDNANTYLAKDLEVLKKYQEGTDEYKRQNAKIEQDQKNIATAEENLRKAQEKVAEEEQNLESAKQKVVENATKALEKKLKELDELQNPKKAAKAQEKTSADFDDIRNKSSKRTQYMNSQKSFDLLDSSLYLSEDEKLSDMNEAYGKLQKAYDELDDDSKKQFKAQFDKATKNLSSQEQKTKQK